MDTYGVRRWFHCRRGLDGFDCARSVNEVICHGIPDQRPLQNGDIVNLDISVFHRGHHSDLNETYFIGEVDEESVKLVETAYACLAAAVDLCT